MRRSLLLALVGTAAGYAAAAVAYTRLGDAIDRAAAELVVRRSRGRLARTGVYLAKE